MLDAMQKDLGGPVVQWLSHYWGPVVIVAVAVVYLFGRRYLGDWFDGNTDAE
jgi:hypothetical protein